MTIGITHPDYDAGLPEPPEKPCARKLRLPSGAQTWCGKPPDHLDPTSKNFDPECHGVTPRELAPMTALDPRRRPQWGR